MAKGDGEMNNSPFGLDPETGFDKPQNADPLGASAATGYKPLRMQVVVHNGMVSIETPGMKGERDFYFAGLYDRKGEIVGGLQANNKDPEWPQLRKKLMRVAGAAIKAYRTYQNGGL